MNIKIYPSKLSGTVKAPSSKSMSHRMIIAAALGDGVSAVRNVTGSADITATVSVMKNLGADIVCSGNDYTVTGIFACERGSDGIVTADCGESGSTLRFLIPVAAALGRTAEFHGRGKLPQRPITPYLRELPLHGVKFDYNDTMPFTVSGKLEAGKYFLEGDISSQFITGLMMALPLCGGDSEIRLTSELQSKPYVDMTAESLAAFGVDVEESVENCLYVYRIKGGKYKSCDVSVEGDYSQAAFFFTANALGCSVEIENLRNDSSQGDKAIVDIIERCGGGMLPFTVDAGNIPDLVPILAVLGCFTSGESRIVNAARLRIKESDRLEAISSALNAIGGQVKADADSLTMSPVSEFSGGTVDACNDHRIVMAAAVASVKSSAPVTIIGAEAVNKSYPGFFDDFKALGGKFEVL